MDNITEKVANYAESLHFDVIRKDSSKKCIDLKKGEVIYKVNFEYVNDYDESRPSILVDKHIEIPHLISFEIKDKEYNCLCLYEDNEIVWSMLSEFEKIQFVLHQLFRLLSLSKSETEKNYQAEFLTYWNFFSKNNGKTIETFLDSSKKYSWLEIFTDKTNPQNQFLVDNTVEFNERYKKKIRKATNAREKAIFVKIDDSSGVLPIRSENSWGIDDLQFILNNKITSKVSYEFYENILLKTVNQTKSIIFVFEMEVDNQSVTFACRVIFKNSGSNKLINKLESEVANIEVIKIHRCDLEYLHKQIGNSTVLLGKKVAVIGAGSLGSYILHELIKIGISDFEVFDNDKVSPENVLRSRYNLASSYIKKADAQSIHLEYEHPQIHVKNNYEAINSENIIEKVAENVDLVVFAVGSSDVQLSCNRVLVGEKIKTPILYSWLEAKGAACHILGISSQFTGCYKCLFTDSDGHIVNNKVNFIPEDEVEKSIIKSGCGATRVAYGNSILLQGAFLTIKGIERILSENLNSNFLLSFHNDEIFDRGSSFYEGKCDCCGEDL